jgi:6-phosphogluconolactonase
MEFRDFESTDALIDAAAKVLREALQAAGAAPVAVMLSGGRTPRPLYESIAAHPFTVAPAAHIVLSDERMVPEESPESNFGQIRPMLDRLELPEDRVLRVDTSLPLQQAADQYDSDLQAFFARGGRIGLAFLGLGADGHTASLFTRQDLESARGRLTVAVRPASPPDRVSVTPAVLGRCDRVIFLASGPEKQAIVSTLRRAPDAVVAGQAVRDAKRAELWFAEEP